MLWCDFGAGQRKHLRPQLKLRACPCYAMTPHVGDQLCSCYNKSLCFALGHAAMLRRPVLQVKNFGRRGRTKHTHLVDQDTTVFDDDLAPERALQDAYFKRVAGVSQTFVKPKTLPINEKRHITGKDKRIAEAGSSRAAYPKNNY